MWSGSVDLEPGRLIYSGRVGVAHRHSHAAVLLALVTSGRVVIVDSAGSRVSMTAAALPVGAIHEMHGLFASCVLAYLDPASRSGILLGQRIAAAGDPGSAQTWVRAAEPIAALWASTYVRDPSALVAQALDVVVGPSTAVGSGVEDHPALRAAVEVLPRMLDGPVRVGELAERVGLTADRLGRLFAERLGLSFPAYVRWLRLRAAMLRVRDGATLTDAAHAAGFADSAHLTRVCRETFGMAPGRARAPHPVVRVTRRAELVITQRRSRAAVRRWSGRPAGTRARATPRRGRKVQHPHRSARRRASHFR